MLIYVVIYLYAYWILPFLLVYVMVYDREYFSFVATSAFVTSFALGVILFPTDQLVLSGLARYLTYILSILHIVYLVAFAAYKLNKVFREKYFPRLFLGISFLNLILGSILFFI